MPVPNAEGSYLGNGRNGLVAVAIDEGKASKHAMKWAADNLLAKGQIVILIHVIQRPPTSLYCNNYVFTGHHGADADNNQILKRPTMNLLLPYHCFLTRKDIQFFDVVLEDTNIAKAITEFVANAGIETLVLGASRRGFIGRLNTADVPTSVSQGSPNFCTVYVIAQKSISSVGHASRHRAPFPSPLIPQIEKMQAQANRSKERKSKDLRAKEIEIMQAQFNSRKERKSVDESEGIEAKLCEMLDTFVRNIEGKLEDIARQISQEFDAFEAKLEDIACRISHETDVSAARNEVFLDC